MTAKSETPPASDIGEGAKSENGLDDLSLQQITDLAALDRSCDCEGFCVHDRASDTVFGRGGWRAIALEMAAKITRLGAELAESDSEREADMIMIVKLQAELAEANARIAKLEARLEIDRTFTFESEDHGLIQVEILPEECDDVPDGIKCRDNTIKLLEERLAEAQEQLLSAQMDGHDMAKNEYRDRIAEAEARAAVAFAEGIEAARKVIRAMDTGKSEGDHLTYNLAILRAGDAIRALTPPDITAAAARVLLPELEKRHQAYIAGKGRDPEKYTSSFHAAAKCLRAIAEGGSDE